LFIETLPSEFLLPIEDFPAVGSSRELFLVVKGKELGSLSAAIADPLAHSERGVGVFETKSHQTEILASNLQDGREVLVSIHLRN